MSSNVIDTAINGEASFTGKAYFFKRSQYVRFDWAKDRMDDGYPLAIAATWRGLPSDFAAGIDAAINGEASFAGKAYLFRGSRYIRYDWAKDRMDDGYPQAIAATWRGLPSDFAAGIDAAINGEASFAGKAYLFKGDQYIRYDWAKDRMDDGYPQPISAWGLPDGLG